MSPGIDLGVPGLARHLEDRLEAVRGRLVGPEHPEVVRVPGHDVADERAGHVGRLARRAARLGHVDGVLAEVGHDQLAQEQAAVGVRVGAHSMLAVRGQRGELGPERALLVEQLLGLVAAHPGLEQVAVAGVRPSLVDRDLMGAPRALDLLAVHDLRAGPALGRPKDDHRPLRAAGRLARPRRRLDLADLVEDRVEGRGQLLVDDGRVVALDEVRLVAVADHQVAQLVLGDAGQDGGVGDLVAVEMEDRQDGAVAHRVEELVRMPAGRQRAGLGLAVADDAADQQVGVVEGGAVGVRERVAELAALVDRAGGLGRDVAGDAARERELAEELAHAVFVPGDARVELGVAALEVRVGDQAGAAVPGADDVDGVEVAGLDLAVHVGVDQVQARRGAPVAQQPRLDVARLERPAQQRVVEQVDLADAQVVGGPPVGVDEAELFGRKRSAGGRRRSSCRAAVSHGCVSCRVAPARPRGVEPGFGRASSAVVNLERVGARCQGDLPGAADGPHGPARGGAGHRPGRGVLRPRSGRPR